MGAGTGLSIKEVALWWKTLLQQPVQKQAEYSLSKNHRFMSRVVFSNECFFPSRGNSIFSSGVEFTAVSLQSSIRPPAPGWPSDHDPDDPGCVCKLCLDLLIQCITTHNSQGGNCMAGATSVENNDVSERPTALVSPQVGTTSENDVHQQPGSVKNSELPSKKSRQSSPQKPPERKWACSHPGCTKSCNKARSLRKHEAHHQGKMSCPHSGCTNSCNSAQRLREHEASHNRQQSCDIDFCETGTMPE